jgi:hypothetical protein
MKIIGQPESYSDMLERIFSTTLISGILCTLLLAQASPAFHALIQSVSTQADLGPIKNLKAFYILIPLGVAFIARVILLHDKISDMLRLRHRFDTRYILFPMAERVGFKLTAKFKKRLEPEREPAMYAVFYPFAGFKDPAIDAQLVRTALDRWGWFWAALEAAFLLFVTLLVLASIRQWYHLLLIGIGILLLVAFMKYQWSVCCEGARQQIEAILQDPSRMERVRSYFAKLSESKV